MTIKNVKKTYELKLDFQVKINEDKELEIIQDSIEELRVLFENHPKKPLLESLWMLGNPSKYACLDNSPSLCIISGSYLSPKFT